MAYTKPALRKRIVAAVKAGSKGGRAGQWSARKAQIAAQRYRAAGGGYTGGKSKAQKSLSKWTKADWGYASGKKAESKPKSKRGRYLPKAARAALTKGEKAATSRAKNKATKSGKQFSRQPKRIANKTKRYR